MLEYVREWSNFQSLCHKFSKNFFFYFFTFSITKMENIHDSNQAQSGQKLLAYLGSEAQCFFGKILVNLGTV